MKKIFISLALALFILPLTAGAASVTIVNSSTSGGGFVTDGNGTTSATANHNNITGAFTDVWNVEIDPTSSIFSLGTSNFFSDFHLQYQVNGAGAFADYNPHSTSPGFFDIENVNLTGIDSLVIKVTGQLNNASFTTGGYNLSVTASNAPITPPAVGAVPVPAAAWLFGSALMGLVGVSRRKSSAVVA